MDERDMSFLSPLSDEGDVDTGCERLDRQWVEKRNASRVARKRIGQLHTDRSIGDSQEFPDAKTHRGVWMRLSL
jgi:hypothetical protein